MNTKTTTEAELEALQPLMTERDFDRLEAELRLRANVLGWTGDPMRQPAEVVLVCARQVLGERGASVTPVREMRTKSVRVRDNYSLGRATLALPDTPLGSVRGGNGAVKEIIEVPVDMPAVEVLQRWNEVVDATGFGKSKAPRYTFRFSELARGAIILS